MPNQPLVTILITARNRADELERTLELLKKQTYDNLEVLVIDDASEPSLEPVVRAAFPAASFVRNEINQGLIANRTTGMRMARGAYTVSLDDDSCFTKPDDLARAVERMEAEPKLGVLTFFVFHGPAMPEQPLTPPAARYVSTFIGCGHMIRATVIQQVGGYRDFYFYYGEEPELSLRILDRGWHIYLMPSVLIHHRVSQTGRRKGRIAGYSLRNNIWTVLLNMPWTRAVVQTGWRFWSHSIECLRLGEVRSWLWAIGSLAAGLPRILRLRQPIQPQTLHLIDLLRIHNVTDMRAVASLRRPSFTEVVSAFHRSFRNRPRSRSWWDRRPGDLGQSEESSFAHEFPQPRKDK